MNAILKDSAKLSASPVWQVAPSDALDDRIKAGATALDQIKSRVFGSKREEVEWLARMSAESLARAGATLSDSECTDRITRVLDEQVARMPKLDPEAVERKLVEIKVGRAKRSSEGVELTADVQRLVGRMSANVASALAAARLIEDNSEYQRRLGIDALPRWFDRSAHRFGSIFKQAFLYPLGSFLALSLTLFALVKVLFERAPADVSRLLSFINTKWG